MTTKLLINLFSYAEPIFCGAALLALLRSKGARKFLAFSILLLVRLLSSSTCLAIMELSRHGLGKRLAYQIYFYVYWVSYAVEAILALLVVYGIFQLAMAPLKGLADLGRLVFRWAAAISVAIACGIAIIPHQVGAKFLVAMVMQLQQTSSILTLCLLLFVCFAIRPLGLSYRSRIFGVSFGLGVMAAVSLVDAAWISLGPAMYSAINIASGVAGIATLFIWTAYFTLPEPERRMIIVPTTSPYLKWNQISEVLGDDPGFVALGVFNPAFFAPAEWEIMARASEKMEQMAAPPVPRTPEEVVSSPQPTFNPSMLTRSA